MYWLIKSEPSKYSWENFVADKQTFWDGVRNYTARNNLKAMKANDEVFFYHSNEGLEIVGIARVIKEAYQDPTVDDSNWVVVDLAPVKKLNKPVTLAAIKAEKKLEGIALVKLSRLSVCPITSQEWNIILEMSDTK
jgi:predicted RNA-binding protein with PUA-like domain